MLCLARGGFGRHRRGFAKGVEQMLNTEQWIAEEHSWAGVAHDPLNLISLGRGIAMHFAVITGGLAGLKGATFEALYRIDMQLPTGAAQPPACTMMPIAIDAGHGFKGAFFTFYPSCQGDNLDLGFA